MKIVHYKHYYFMCSWSDCFITSPLGWKSGIPHWTLSSAASCGTIKTSQYSVTWWMSLVLKMGRLHIICRSTSSEYLWGFRDGLALAGPSATLFEQN